MPVQKIDSRCASLSVKADAFLGLGSLGKLPQLPPDFWKTLAQDNELVSSYIVCLIAKLIALDSGHGQRPLPEVYRDLVELPVEFSKYRQWASKQLPNEVKSLALELQFCIVNTIYFLREFYGYSPSIHLRNMYLRWNLARSSAADGAKILADGFEEKVITVFSVAQSKQLKHPSSSPSVEEMEVDDKRVVRSLVEECCLNHRRASFGVLPPPIPKLCHYTSVTETLSHAHLRALISQSPVLLQVAMRHLVALLKQDTSHTGEEGDREVLLPKLQLFKQFISMMSPFDTVEAYQTMMHFYTWPTVYAESARKVLDTIMLEGRAHGTTFRRNLISEHNVGFRLKNKKLRGQLIHMIVDTSRPFSRGRAFFEIIKSHQEYLEQRALQELLVRNAFRSVFSSFDVVELQKKLQHLSSATLRSVCIHAVEAMEQAAAVKVDTRAAMEADLNDLYKKILKKADSEEQRDSAVSCNSSGEDFTEETLANFSLPAPPFPSHALTNSQYPTVLAKLREILVKSLQRDSPQIPDTPQTSRGRILESRPLSPTEDERHDFSSDVHSNTDVASSGTSVNGVSTRTFSNSSRTSMDSTGSSSLEREERVREGERPKEVKENGGTDLEWAASRENSSPETTSRTALPNGHLPDDGARNESVVVGNTTGLRENHVTSPDSGLVTSSPVPNSPGARKEDEEEGGRKTEEEKVESETQSERATDVNCRRPSSAEPLRPRDSMASSGTESVSRIDQFLDSVFPDSISQTSSDTTGSESVGGAVGVASTNEHPSGMRDKSTSLLVDELHLPPDNQPLTGKILQRRATAPSFSPMLVRGSGTFGSGATPVGKKYSNVAGQSALIRTLSSVGSIKVKSRPNPTASLSVRQRKKPSVLSPTHKTNLKLFKIVLAGNDLLVSHAARAYTYLRSEEPNLFSGMDVRFYHIPLSQASSAYHTLVERGLAAPAVTTDLPEPMTESLDSSGNDVHIGRYLSQLDSWYERNVMVAMHNTLRLLPNDAGERAMSPVEMEDGAKQTDGASRTKLGISPAKIIVNTVADFCREANHCVSIRMCRVKLTIKAEKAHRIESREEFMLHRLDIQRLHGKRVHRQVKPFEANINMTELTLDNSFLRSDVTQMKDVWSVRAYKIPRSGDFGVPNPETECFELNIVKAATDGGRLKSSKPRFIEDLQYHVYELVLETRDKPLTVMIDGDTNMLIENVIRLEVTPAYMDQSFSLSSKTSIRRNDHRLEKQQDFPLMTFWPVDLP